MRLAVLFLALLGLLAAQETGNDCPHKKSATLLPSFTVTPTATESTANPTTTQGPTTSSPGNSTIHPTSKSTTSPGHTTATHNPATTSSPGNSTIHPTSNSTATSPGHTTATHNPATITSPGNATTHPTTSNGTSTSPGLTSSPHPRPPPPSPSPSPSSQEAIGDYMWTNGSQPCVRLQARIQIRVLYPTHSGGKAWGVSVLNPNKTKVQGGCEGAHPHLFLSFPYGQLSFGFKQDLQQSQSMVYLNYMAVEYNVSFPQAAQWTFSAQNSSLQDLQAPLGRSFSCRNASIILSPALHLDLLSLRLQAAQLPHTEVFGPSFSCPSDQFTFLPLIIGLILLGLLTLVLVAFCILRRRPSTYQPL
ncbi:macrosialin [Ictidomys tridecemlineatus]|uniref:macrosialin n=1 Tax=Ictidomys tridecemlineatus TaxID=43179 RepID=UPI00038C07E5|nr:macrosialin [Ictidomys tridecemlineatus]KAG3269884.1 CD68 molecule [Ictidomys tridecemlineatus]